MEVWRRITTYGAPPEFNMGLDEALLESKEAPPTLRFYTWNPATLSLGYFQRWNEVAETERASSVVRRITGGGAIHHRNELTFSIATSLDHPLYHGTIQESYERVHAAIADALKSFGIEAESRGDRSLESDDASTGMCFHKSTAVDLVWNERKGVGSAQRRTRGRILHHGSIKLDTTPLEGDIATIASAGSKAAPGDVANALSASLTKLCGLEFETSVPDPRERERARELGARYVSREFLERR